MHLRPHILRLLTLLWLLCAAIAGLFAQAPAPKDSLRVSLLTCYPGAEIYELCGHTAIRIRTAETDTVWNYGVFDYTAPNFVYRFVKGETDYMVLPMPTQLFLDPYRYYGRRVVEQDLNLTQAEARKLRKLLQVESLPQNREYRYNYVKDNCATRPRLRLEQSASTDFIYPREGRYGTFRKEMNAYHAKYPWYQFGIDLALGSGLDYELDATEEWFVPIEYMQGMAQARRVDTGAPLVLNTTVINEGMGDVTLDPTPWPLTPLAVSLYTMALAILLCVLNIKHLQITRWAYALWFGITGLAGILIAFLVFVSTHEATSPNFLIWWLNPFALFIPFTIWSRRLRAFTKGVFWFVAITCGTLLLSWPFISQSTNAAILIFMGVSFIMSVTYLYVVDRQAAHSPAKKRTAKKGATKKGTRKGGRARATLILLLGASTLTAGAERPKLVVNIVVDQLRTDYLEALKGQFRPDGLARLMNKGVYMRDVDFGVATLDPASATALIFTGAYPASSGITAATLFDSETGRRVSSLADPNTVGNFTTATFSPENLRLSTFTDELAIDGKGVSAIHSLATSPEQAVIMAGHAGSSALWLDNNTGKWASSTYYQPVPTSVTSLNYQRPLSARIDTMTWRPAAEMAKYVNIPKLKKTYTFSHTFSSSDRDVYKRWSATPLANREITDLACDYLATLQLGNRTDAIDVLSLGYTAAPYPYVKDGDFRFELQDTYLRLDADLARLLNAIDKSVGLQNTVVLLTSTGYYDDATIDDPRFKIPTGTLSTKRMVSLLNSFLSAKYGNGDFVKGYADRQLFLNRKLVEERRVPLETLRAEARDFLLKMSGIEDAVTLGEISASQSARLEPLRRALDPKSAGDIYITPNSGWTLLDDTLYPATSTPVRASSVLSPLIIMAPGVAPRVVDATVDALRIAPTMTQTMGVRAPNAAGSRPLPIF